MARCSQTERIDVEVSEAAPATSGTRVRRVASSARSGWQQLLIVSNRSPAGAAPDFDTPKRRADHIAPHRVVPKLAHTTPAFSEVMTTWPERARRVVLRAAFLPRLTAHSAATVTGDIDAVSILERLAVQRGLILRDHADSTTLRYSAPFREYARRLARETLSSEDLAEVLWRTTALLEQELVAREDDPTGAPMPSPCSTARLRIAALGRFAVSRDGKPLAGGRKAAAKSLALLKALAALGGEAVAAYKVADLLWPDAEGDTALARLNATLYRTRKLLRIPQAILVQEGFLSLNRQVVDCDVFVFEQVVQELERSVCSPTEQSARLLRAYSGTLLPEGEAHQWLYAARERLAAKFTSAVLRLGRRLQADGDAAAAQALYLEAMAREPLAAKLRECLFDAAHSGPQRGSTRASAAADHAR